jgi:hypothetical protein
MMDETIRTIILILLLLVSIPVQIFLSRKDKYAGLVLPTLTFIRYLNLPFTLWKMGSSIAEILGNYLMVNIPTIAYILIYVLSRKKIKQEKDIEKMNIQDL